MTSFFKNINTSIFWSFVLSLFFIGGVTSPSYAQNKKTKKAKKEVAAKKNTNTAIREEIQRYMGYEQLPARYLSLPYDASMNTNVRGPFVDISYLFFLFVPIFFLMGYWKKPLAGTLFMLFCLIILTISVGNSTIVSPDATRVYQTKAEIQAFIQEASFSDAPINYVVAQLHIFFRTLYQPFEGIFNSISGESDYITYPLLIVFFVLGFFVLLDRIKNYNLTIRAVGVFTYFFCFLWLLLTAGIIWYGYLMLAIATIYLAYSFSKKLENGENEALFLQKGVRYLSIGALGFAIFLFLAFRLTNYIQATDQKSMAKQMLFDPAMLKYQLGTFTESQTLDNFYFGISSVLKRINRDENALVYRVGTVLPFFVTKNDKRILGDNQLGIFNNIASKYKNQQTIADVLKASNFKYILVDLNTHRIDETPEKSLTKKFQTFMEFIYFNPKLELLTTDRGIVVPGEPIMERKVFPNSDNGEQLGYAGSFAIYEIK